MNFKKVITYILVGMMLTTSMGQGSWVPASTVMAADLNDTSDGLMVSDGEAGEAENTDFIEKTIVSENPDVTNPADSTETDGTMNPGDSEVTVPSTPDEDWKIPSEGITLDQTSVSLKKGDSVTLIASIFPENSTESISWKSSDERVAVVEAGVVTAVGSGKATITASTESGFFASCEIEVPSKATSLSISKETLTITLGSKTNLKVTPDPEDCTEMITWSSESSSIASVSPNTTKDPEYNSYGTVTAKQIGQTKITAVTESGAKVECVVYVRVPAPTNLVSKRAKVNQTKLSWDPVPEATGYRVYRSTTEEGGYTKVKDVSQGVTTYTDSVSNGKKYYYKLKALYAANSNCRSASTAAVKGKVYPLISVPRYNQYSYGLPSGCEATAAAMLLKFYKVSATPTSFVSQMEKLKLIRSSNESPEDYFVGHPTWGGYGCYSKPIVKTIKTLLPEGKKAYMMNGRPVEDLRKQVDAGRPVLIWATMTYTISDADTYREVGMYKTMFGSSSWWVPRLNTTYYFKGCEHCLVLVGYDSTYYYLNDPMNGRTVKCRRATVETSYKDQGQFAAVVKNVS